MTALTVVSTVLGVLGTACAIVFGYLALTRNKGKDTANKAKQDAVVYSDIGYIKANTDEIKAEQKEQRKTNIEFISRLTAVEESTKQAHKRINRLEGNEK